jgi:integrase
MSIHPWMPFREAAPLWLASHRGDISENTARDYRFYIRNLGRVLGEKRLGQITLGDVLEYQQTRKRTVGHQCVNHEICTLRQILQAADLWDPISRYYKPLKAPQWTPPKVLTPDEEQRFFQVAASRPEWRVAYLACTLANHTSAIGSELRFLRLHHVLLDHEPPIMRVNDARVKNEFRVRTIPLNVPAAAAISELVDRAKGLGACRPDHYVFPFRVKKGEYDVKRPASAFFIRSAFRSMREATGLEWLQHRNFRNQVITKLFESGAPDETITSIAGHSSIRMSRFYSQVRIEARADALNCIAGAALPRNKPAKKPGLAALRAGLTKGEMVTLSAMKEAALLVKEAGVDVATALAIVRGVRGEAPNSQGSGLKRTAPRLDCKMP